MTPASRDAAAARKLRPPTEVARTADRRPASTRRRSAATSPPMRCAISTFPISRSIPARAFAACTTRIVNYLGNTTPQMLLCLHEEAAVAIAHGYAKVTDKPMAAAVHSNVGLMHASMAMFNAWCDRLPVIVLGATGPVDAAKRRPWIDWIHTARDQGALVRNYTKWDDQPASPAAAREAILRAGWIANNVPKGPVYINLDADVQEMKLAEPLPPLDASRLMPQVETGAPPELLRKAADMLMAAKHPLILIGRVSRDQGEWNRRVAARRSDRRQGRRPRCIAARASRPTIPLHVEPPTTFNGAATQQGHGGSRRDPQPRLGRSRRHDEGPQGGPPARSSRSRWTITSITAGAWTTWRCPTPTC